MSFLDNIKKQGKTLLGKKDMTSEKALPSKNEKTLNFTALQLQPTVKERQYEEKQYQEYNIKKKKDGKLL